MDHVKTAGESPERRAGNGPIRQAAVGAARGVRRVTWRVACLAVFLVPVGTAHAQPWWDPNWLERKKLTINNSDQTEDLDDFPLLVKLDGTRIDYSKTLNLGEDIRFIDNEDDGATELKYEIEKWDESGTSYVWVKVPRIDGSSSTDHIWIYYDYFAASDNQDPANVWTSGYAGVWHLKEDPTPAGGSWYGPSWDYRKKITIDNTKVTATLADFPVLISVTDTDIKAAARTDGFDILFTNSDSVTKLDHEIEKWDISTGELVAWVKIPSLPDFADKDIYVYYGNSGAADQQNVAGVWSSSYAGVWHMDETSGTTIDDSTSTSDAIKLAAAEPAASTGGQIDGAQDFDGTNDVATASDVAGLDLTNAGTIEVWISADDTTSAESAFSGWTSKTPPPGTEADTGNDGVDLTVVGQKIYYAALLHDGNGTSLFRTANSNLNGSSFIGWTTQSSPGGNTDNEDTASIAIDSDGDTLYYAAFLHDRENEYFGTGSSDLDGGGFSGWTSRAAPDGADRDHRSGIDMTIVDGTIYYAAFLHKDVTEKFHTANMPLGGGALTWTNQTAPDGAGDKDTTSVGIDSDGSTLYYAAFAHSSLTEYFYTASSNLNGTGFSVWTTQTPPAGAGDDEASFIDMTLVGDRMYFSALMLDGTIETFQTANAKLDGTDFSGWTVRVAPILGGGGRESAVSSIATDGKTLYYTAFLHNGSTEYFYIASSTVTSHPVVSKADAYELIQTGGGFVLDWEGSPKSFGSVSASTLAHLAVTHDGTTMIYYVDGVEERQQTVAADFLSNANDLQIGGGGTFFDGIIDEVRLASVSRSADWILIGYNNQSNPGGFHTVDIEEPKPVAGFMGDSTANNNTGTSAGVMGAMDQVAGQIDGSLDFDGFDDQINVPDSASLDIAGDKMTVSAWILPDFIETTPSGFFIVGKFATVATWRLWFRDGSDDFRFRINAGGSSTGVTTTDLSWTAGTPHYLVGVYNGTNMIIYWDGSQEATTAKTGTLSTNDEDLTIGQRGAAPLLPFDGIIDEVRVANVARSDDWITAQYKSITDTFINWKPKIIRWTEVDPFGP